METKEEGEVSGTGVLEEEEAWYEDDYEYGDGGTTTSGEEIDGPDGDGERDDYVSDEDEDVNRDTIPGGEVSEADEWESGRSDRDEDRESLGADDTEESDLQGEIEEEESGGEGRGDLDLPPKAAKFLPYLKISTDTAAAGGTCKGPL